MNKSTLGIFVITILLIANLLNSVYGTGPILTSEIFKVDTSLLLIFSGSIIPLFSLLIIFLSYRKKTKPISVILLMIMLIFLCLANIYWIVFCRNIF